MPIFIAILALGQAALGVLRALQWFDVGVDLLGQGIVLLPFIGVIAIARGTLVISVAMLYLLFAVGLLLHKSWAWWLGIFVSAINVLLVINVVVQAESASRAGFWLIAPIIITAYLLSPPGRAATMPRREVNS
jgi:hypothetical protein